MRFCLSFQVNLMKIVFKYSTVVIFDTKLHRKAVNVYFHFIYKCINYLEIVAL